MVGLPLGASAKRYRVARGGEELGEFPAKQLRIMIGTGELNWEDHYFDTASNKWLELVCIESQIVG